MNTLASNSLISLSVGTLIVNTSSLKWILIIVTVPWRPKLSPTCNPFESALSPLFGGRAKGWGWLSSESEVDVLPPLARLSLIELDNDDLDEFVGPSAS